MSKKSFRLQRSEQKTGLRKSKIYNDISLGTFPAQLSLGGGSAVGWIEGRGRRVDLTAE